MAQHYGVNTMNLPLVNFYKPVSFQERGVAVPFTTPQLAGARVRPAERTGTEFIVPNPSGGRGVYVLSWGGVRQLSRPTVHDTLLHQRISRLPIMDPRGVRTVARQLAAEGLAGREAAIAATAAIAAESGELVLINFLLLLTLMEQVEPAGLKIGPETGHTPELDRRARRIVSRFGAATGRGSAQISEDLEGLSFQFLAIGLNAEAPCARLPRLTARLTNAAASLTSWARRLQDDEFGALASSLARTVTVAAGCADATIRTARGLIANMPLLLRTWAETPAAIAEQTSRPEWVLDGWERICLLWETTTQVSAQRAVLREMAQLVPLLPREAAEWSEARQELDNQEPILRNARLNDGWRGGGASFGLIARNERLQALIA